MKTVSLYCIAPDGAIVREGAFPSVESAWTRASDMGSRWFFYPICVVAGCESGPYFNLAHQKQKIRIRDVPQGMSKEWIGKTLGRLAAVIAANAEHACAYVEGKCPFIPEP